MQKVTELLNRFLHLAPKDKKIKDVATEVLLSMFPSLTRESVALEFQNSILFVRAGNTFKHALQIKKTEVISSINTKIGADTVKDIR